MQIQNTMAALWRDETAQEFIEYALLAAFIAIVAAMGPSNLAPPILRIWTRVEATITNFVALMN